MKRFSCSCASPVFFDNALCTRCGTRLGFDSRTLQLVSLTQDADSAWRGPGGEPYRLCRNALDYDNCNWLVAGDDLDEYCVSCRLNRTIPDLSAPANRDHWNRIEAAKRRLVYSLLQLGLTVASQTRGWPHGLAFDFVEDQRSNPAVEPGHVLTGHDGGIITINVAEADDVIRAMARKQMNEGYRTLLGHFRHESGHYFFAQLVWREDTLEACRALFGDERTDYDEALQGYYTAGPPAHWSEHHISAYAAAHPAEDWAETWAHYLHMLDCLETASAYGLIETPGDDFERLLGTWVEFSVVLNELSRSMGLRDAYPFVVSEQVAQKLGFVHTLLRPGA